MIPAILPKIQPIKITTNFGITNNYYPLQDIGIFYNTMIAKNTGTKTIAIVGDIIGDPYKDTAGPALNTVIKLLNTIAIVFVPVFFAVIVL